MAHKILVVDDQSFMVRLIQHHLERAGYELIKANNSEEANAAIAQNAPNLVLTTEKSSTLEARHPSKSTIPVIRMTDVPATMADPLQSSDAIIFRKPFSPAKLLAEVKRLLSKNSPESISK